MMDNAATPAAVVTIADGPLLIADARERVIHDALTVQVATMRDLPHAPTLLIATLATGDYIYARTHNHNPIAVLERKSLTDYAASIRDGRHENKQRMIDMRTATGCRVFYLIEGGMPKADQYYGRMPGTTLISSIMNLMTRDGIFVCVSRNRDDTARVLVDLCTSLTKHGGASAPTHGGNMPLPRSLTHREPIPILTVKVAALTTIPFITKTSYSAITQNDTLSIADILCGRAPQLSPRVSASVDRVNNTPASVSRLLQSINGVSVAIGDHLSTTSSLQQLIDGDSGVAFAGCGNALRQKIKAVLNAVAAMPTAALIVEAPMATLSL